MLKNLFCFMSLCDNYLDIKNLYLFYIFSKLMIKKCG